MSEELIIITTSTFKKDIKKLNKRYRSIPDDLSEFRNRIIENPDLGVDYGSGIRKARMAIKSKSRGKSASARVITYKDVLFTSLNKVIYFVHIFDKSDKSSVSKAEVIDILKKEGLI